MMLMYGGSVYNVGSYKIGNQVSDVYLFQIYLHHGKLFYILHARSLSTDRGIANPWSASFLRQSRLVENDSRSIYKDLWKGLTILFKNKSILSLKKIEDLNLKEEAAVAQLVQLILILSSFVKQMTALMLVLVFLMAITLVKGLPFVQVDLCPNSIETSELPFDWGNKLRVQYMNDG